MGHWTQTRQWEILELKSVVPTLPLLAVVVVVAAVVVVLPTVFVFVASSPMEHFFCY